MSIKLIIIIIDLPSGFLLEDIDVCDVEHDAEVDGEVFNIRQLFPQRFGQVDPSWRVSSERLGSLMAGSW